MLATCEGIKIDLQPYENYHEKVFGKSGSGKTWWACRRMEKYAITMPVFVIDISGSYTEYELTRNKVSRRIKTRSMNPKEQIVVLSVEGNDLADYVTDALIITLGVKSMMQRQLLKEVCEEILGVSRVITFRRLFAKLEESGSETSDSERKKNIDFLMNRMYHLRRLDTLQVVAGRTRTSPGVYIWELSDFPDRVSKLLAQFILEIIWKKIRSGTKERVQIILDEFQRLNIEDTAVEEMLREGRKYDLGLTMLSQYMPHGREAAHILEQASISLYFQPNERNVISTAKVIAAQDYREWIPVLKNLERGSCVLTGRYSMNRGRNIDTRPIICKVNSCL